MQQTWVQSLVWEDPLEKAMATHSSILAWKISRQRSLVGYSPWGHKESDTPLLGRHLYYTSPFYGSYTNYGNLNAALQGQGLLRYNSAAAAPGEALHAAPKAASDAGKVGAHPLPEPHYRPPGGGYEPKKGRRPAGPRGRRGAVGPGGRHP